MRAIRYLNTSADKAVPKQLNSVGAEIDITLKDSTDILHPVITISPPNVSQFMDYNYLYIPDLHRYYFVRGHRLCQQYIEMTLDVDPLESWWAQLKGQSVIYARQSKNYNSYQRDDQFVKMEYGDVSTVPVSADKQKVLSNRHMSYILIAAGAAGGIDEEVRTDV